MKYFASILFVLSVHIGLSSPWNPKTKFPNNGRHRGASFAIGNKGYVGLGHMNGTGINQIFTDWWEYDPASNSWTQKANYPTGTYGVSIFVLNNIGYIGGGTGLNGEFYGFNPLTNQWTQITDCPGFPSDETAFAINGKGYATENGNFYEYDPSTDQWTTKAPCPVVSWSISSFVIDGKGYVKGGNSLYEYKPSVDQWIQKATFPGLATGGSAAFSLNQRGYIIGGYGGALSNVTAEFWEFNPATNSWTVKDEFPGTARRFPTAFTIGNIAYFTLGTNGTNMNDFWQYNPELEGVGLKENNNKIFVTTYPNPATTEIHFNFSEKLNSNSLQITVFNLNGEIVFESLTSEQMITINRHHLAAGKYIYTITNANQLLTKGTFIFN